MSMGRGSQAALLSCGDGGAALPAPWGSLSRSWHPAPPAAGGSRAEEHLMIVFAQHTNQRVQSSRVETWPCGAGRVPSAGGCLIGTA